jgi:hypothetical protein
MQANLPANKGSQHAALSRQADVVQVLHSTIRRMLPTTSLRINGVPSVMNLSLFPFHIPIPFSRARHVPPTPLHPPVVEIATCLQGRIPSAAKHVVHGMAVTPVSAGGGQGTEREVVRLFRGNDCRGGAPLLTNDRVYTRGEAEKLVVW